MKVERLGFRSGRRTLPTGGGGLDWRPMRQEDLEAVVALEQRLFASPWSRAMFEEEIEEREHVLALVAVDGVQLAGYLIAYLVADELHIANIGTAPEYQRRGIARAMMSDLLRRGRRHGVEVVHLEVRRSNAPAIALYESLGFRIVGVRKNYYEQEHEDALLMTLSLDDRPRS